MLGIAGVLVAAVAAACGISVIWGGGNAFGLGALTRMAIPTAAGFLLLGSGAVAVALDMSQATLRQPVWAAIGAAVFPATIRIGLLRSFSPKHETGISSALSWLGATFGPVVFGVFVHLALKAHLQRELLRRAEHATHLANEQLEQRVEERTRALEAANEELRGEIARRERVEEDLRKQKEILQTIFDHIPVMVGFVDRNNRFQLVNREWERTLGWSLDELHSQNIDILAENYPDPADRDKARDFIRNSEAEWADFKTKVRDGRVIDISWAVLHLSDGTSIGIGQDISERKRAEQELRQQKEKLQTIFDHIPLMVGFADQEKRVQLVNREWERTLGSCLDEIQGKSVYTVIADHAPDPELGQQVLNFVRHSTAEWTDFKMMVQGGQVIDTSWAVLRLSDGTSIGIGQNISERKRADWELRKQKEILQTIFDHIPVMVGFVDQNGQAQVVNPEWERSLGWSLEEIRSQNIDVIEENYPDPEYRAKGTGFRCQFQRGMGRL